MDERKEILQDTIDRLIETALQELDQKLPEAGGEAALSHISDQLRQDAQLDEQHRKLMLDYIRQLNQVTHCQCRHLYCQGALGMPRSRRCAPETSVSRRRWTWMWTLPA